MFDYIVRQACKSIIGDLCTELLNGTILKDRADQCH